MKFIKLLTAMMLTLVLAGCYDLRAEFNFDEDENITGSVVVTFPNSRDVDLDTLEIFEDGYGPEKFKRSTFQNLTSKGVRIDIEQHDASTRPLRLVGSLQNDPFFTITGNTDYFVARGTSLTANLCSSPSYDQFEEEWDVEVKVNFEDYEFEDRFSFGDYHFADQSDTKGTVTWRPSFGNDEQIWLYWDDPEFQFGIGGPEDLIDTTGCGDEKDYSDLEVEQAPPVVEKPVTTPVGPFSAWTQKISDTEAKIYAKNPVGAGKIQFMVNGEEIAWVRATEITDSKLRRIIGGPMDGTTYLVRTVTLEPGKNALEVYQDGVRVKRSAYTLR